MSSILGFTIGTLLVVNFVDFFKMKRFTNFRLLFNLIFFNYSYGIYDIDKMLNFREGVLNISINYFFVALNFFPILSSFQKRIFGINFIDIFYPSNLTLSTLTIFLNYFRVAIPIDYKYVMLIDILNYTFLILSFINDIFILKSFKTEHIFILVLNIMNLIAIYYFDIFEMKTKILGIYL